MNILLIEDEELASEDLIHALKAASSELQILDVLVSVKQSIQYLKEQEAPDLIFSDIQLGDGLSFEIFDAVQTETPIVFCTAYNDYMLHAFKNNGIDYLLKPVTAHSVRGALEKYKGLKRNFTKANSIPEDFYKDLLKQLQAAPKSLLVHYKDKIIPIMMHDIALFYIDNESTYVKTFDNTSYCISKTLDELERLGNQDFFRVNRQYLIRRAAVLHASYSLSRKLVVYPKINHTDKIMVSKEKSSVFLSWLAGDLNI